MNQCSAMNLLLWKNKTKIYLLKRDDKNKMDKDIVRFDLPMVLPFYQNGPYQIKVGFSWIKEGEIFKISIFGRKIKRLKFKFIEKSAGTSCGFCKGNEWAKINLGKKDKKIDCCTVCASLRASTKIHMLFRNSIVNFYCCGYLSGKLYII